MRKRRLGAYAFAALLVALFVGIGTTSHQALAQTSKSPNYQITESEIGNTSGVESCSGSYCSQVTIGDGGQSSSASSPEFGEAQYSEPMLEMIVVGSESNLGELTTERTGTKTMSVKIRNYETGGYRLQIIGDPPKYGSRQLAPLATPTASQPGKEQFGINVVANTTPAVGSNPVLQPGGGDATSILIAGYGTPNQFKYVSGQTIAETSTNTGGVDLVISMIVNISNGTPAGRYDGDYAAVIMPYF